MKRILFFSVPLLFLVALVVMFASQINRDTSLLPSVLINKPVPEFTLPAIEGIEAEFGNIPGFETADLKGQVSVVNIFASWCIPCRQEHPFLIKLGEEEDVLLIGINQKDAADNALSFLRELGNPYDAIGADANGRISIDWGVYGVPETFVVNAEGIITYKHIGPISEASYSASLLPAIEAARSDET